MLVIVRPGSASGPLRHFGFSGVPHVDGPGLLFVAFVAGWLTLWTVGGLSAMRQLLRLLWAWDRLEYDGAGLRLMSRVGPFVIRREWASDAIRGIATRRRDSALVIDEGSRIHVLTSFGARAEREALRDELRKVLGVASRAPAAADATDLPEDWESERDEAGTLRRFRRRAIRAAQVRVAWNAAAAVAVLAGHGPLSALRDGSWGAGETALVLIVTPLLLLFVGLSLWLSHGREDIGVHAGALEFRRRFLGRTRAVAVRPARLHVARNVDGDGDEWFRLRALDGARRRTLDRAMNAPERVVRLGRWLAAHTGLPLDIDPGMEERPQRLAS